MNNIEKSFRISKSYATALYIEAHKNKIEQKVKDILIIACEISSNYNLLILNNPKFIKILKNNLKLMVEYRFLEEFFKLLQQNNCMGILSFISKKYNKLYNQHHNISEIIVEVSSNFMDKKLQINKIVEKLYGIETIINYIESQEISVGFKIKHGTDLIDATLDNNLHQYLKEITKRINHL
jgi:F0F1-type ATP synthase delta subunit